MVDTQHFCLRWNNYQSSITSAFENLRDDEDFVDVTLACDGKSLKAHRVVLSACSPYFRELLKSTPCKHPVIVLQDVAWTDLHALVEFIYHGEVNVHQRSLSSFLKTAEVLRVSGLTQQHGDDRELAQVQSLVRSQQQQQQQQQQQHPSPPIPNHHAGFAEKLVEEALFASPSPPPPPPPSHGATVNQLLRRAALQHRRERRVSCDPDTEHGKRARPDHHLVPNNNNNELNLSPHGQQQQQPPPPQTQPTDFSPTAMKNNAALHLGLLRHDHAEANNGIGGGGVGGGGGGGGGGLGGGVIGLDRESSPCSQSPPHSLLGGRCSSDEAADKMMKSEPMELLCSGGSGKQEENSNDSTDVGNDNGPNNLPQGPHSGSSGGGDHDEHDSSIGPYLAPSDSKLFTTAAGSFNFSMAALAADPTGLGGLNQSLQANADSLAGTSQDAPGGSGPGGGGGPPSRRPSAPPPPPAPATCDICHKRFSRHWSLQRHLSDTHYYTPQTLRCDVCGRSYRSRNSLVSHRSQYHAAGGAGGAGGGGGGGGSEKNREEHARAEADACPDAEDP